MIGHDFLWRHRVEEKQTCLAERTPALVVFGGEGGVDGTTNQSIRSTHSREGKGDDDGASSFTISVDRLNLWNCVEDRFEVRVLQTLLSPEKCLGCMTNNVTQITEQRVCKYDPLSKAHGRRRPNATVPHVR